MVPQILHFSHVTRGTSRPQPRPPVKQIQPASKATRSHPSRKLRTGVGQSTTLCCVVPHQGALTVPSQPQHPAGCSRCQQGFPWPPLPEEEKLLGHNSSQVQSFPVQSQEITWQDLSHHDSTTALQPQPPLRRNTQRESTKMMPFPNIFLLAQPSSGAAQMHPATTSRAGP